MEAPGLPSNEDARLADLLAYGVLDTPAEPALDALTAAVARLLGVPIALVTLVDDARQWFKSRHGELAPETPRDVSFCGHVVASGEPLVVADAWTDARFFDNPLVTGAPHVRFYAGFPLRNARGFDLGTLCAIDHRPRELSPAHAEVLAALARVAVGLLEQHRLQRQLEAARAVAVDSAHRFEALFEALRRSEEQRLAQQHRLVTAGMLAAGVGHEINTPLAYVVLNVDAALEAVRAAPPTAGVDLVAMLEAARHGAERIKQVVRGLRGLAREEPAARATELVGAIQLALQLASHELRPRATVEVDVPAGLAVAADDSRLSQLLVNLLVNAAQAFATRDPGANRVGVRAAAEPDGMVRLTIADNGPGIPPAVLERIFDPFFTTKAATDGTGLGLSICRNVATALGGTIAVDSTVGVGTRFHVRLPRATIAAPEPAPSPRAAPIGARGRVLVIDDDELLAKTIVRSLARDHDVIAITDPREARARLLAGEWFDAILCDLSMPHLRGDELFEELRPARPALADRFVFLTGGATEPGAEELLATIPNEQLDKPLDLRALRAIVHRQVAAPRPPAPDDN